MEQSRRLRKKDITHRAIMHSAKMLFEKNGIGGVTIDQISNGADVSRSTFFSHFNSLDDLMMQIANEEIRDILDSSVTDGKTDINAVFHQLTIDTYPYPNLMCQLFMRSILSSEMSSADGVLSLMNEEISGEGYEKLKSIFSPEDISAFVFGAYFGLIFKKFIKNEEFTNPAETDDKIQKFINYLKDGGIDNG